MQEAQLQAAKANLVPCRNCQRRFAPDRIPVHERACRGPKKPPPTTVREEASKKGQYRSNVDSCDGNSNYNNRKEPKDRKLPAVGNMSRESSSTVDPGSRRTVPRDYRSMEFDQSRRTPTDHHKPSTRSSVNYRGRLLKLF